MFSLQLDFMYNTPDGKIGEKMRISVKYTRAAN